jgi:DNA-binding NarL/FixJ family response regulator
VSGDHPSAVRVLVAEDQQLVRSGIVTMLTAGGEFEVVAEAGDGQRAVSEARRTRPDVALLDIRMPIMDGIEATRRITTELPATRVLVLTTFGSDDHVFSALAAGAHGFLLKDVRPEELLEAVSAVARGEGRLDSAVTGAVVEHFRQHTPRPSGSAAQPALTAREHEVLKLMAKGMSNAEIATELTVAPGTVKTHVATVLAKLGARDRLQAVIAAFETGLVRP